ncbi:MAG: hypothetical protein JHC95_16065 [Solirubrobacteraceae bacterium]|nr:hypothetical protein [Solirubrobacteraceae bacterium]
MSGTGEAPGDQDSEPASTPTGAAAEGDGTIGEDDEAEDQDAGPATEPPD